MRKSNQLSFFVKLFSVVVVLVVDHSMVRASLPNPSDSVSRPAVFSQTNQVGVHLKVENLIINKANRFHFELSKSKENQFKRQSDELEYRPHTLLYRPDIDVVNNVFVSVDRLLVDSVQVGAVASPLKTFVVLDGVGMIPGFDVNLIDPRRIKSLTVLGRESSVQKYGNQGQERVVEMHTK